MYNENRIFKSRIGVVALTLAAIAAPASASGYYLHLGEARYVLRDFDRHLETRNPDMTGWYVDDCFRLTSQRVNCRNVLSYADGSACIARYIIYYQRSSRLLRVRNGSCTYSHS